MVTRLHARESAQYAVNNLSNINIKEGLFYGSNYALSSVKMTLFTAHQGGQLFKTEVSAGL